MDSPYRFIGMGSAFFDGYWRMSWFAFESRCQGCGKVRRDRPVLADSISHTQQ